MLLKSIAAIILAYLGWAWWQCRCWKHHCHVKPTRGDITFTTPTDL